MDRNVSVDDIYPQVTIKLRRFARQNIRGAKRLALLGSGLVGLLSASPVLALPASTLNAEASAGACGGSVGCYLQNSQLISPASAASTASATQSSTLTDGSYANASASVGFGQAHVYADAHRTAAGPGSAPIGDAQSKGFTEFVDYVPWSSLAPVGGLFTEKFVITGSHSAQDGIPGLSALSYLYYSVTDMTTNTYLGYGNWTSTDTNPTGTVTINVTAPTNHDISLRVDFEVDAYVMSNNDLAHLTAFADYSHTLNVYLDGQTPGADIVGQSGHNYASPLSGGGTVPEPGSFGLLLGGLGLLGWGAQNKRFTRA